MIDSSVTTVRMVDEIEWSYGVNTTVFYPGQIVASNDPRAAGGFTHVAVEQGWAEEFTVGPTKTRAKTTATRKKKVKR
jgi:hypothetical protein